MVSGVVVALVCIYLFGRGDADCFFSSAARRPSPSPPLLCPTCELQLGRRTSQSRCSQRSSRRKKRGKSESGWFVWLSRCARRFPGSVSAPVYKGFGQIFPLFPIISQDSLVPPLCHPVTVTLFLSHPPLVSSLPLHLYPTLRC